MPPSPDAEGSAYEAAKNSLRRWLDRAREKVMAPWRRLRAQPSPTELQATVPAWQAEVDRILAALDPALREGWVAANLPGDYPPNDPYIRANLALTKNLLVRIPDEVHAMVIAQILAGTNAGETTEQIANRVEDVLSFTGSENWDGRARTIAQTECLIGETEVSYARATRAYRRWYEGDLISVRTEQGHHVTGTPNHPMLTRHGWVALKKLAEGDYLVSQKGSVENPRPALYPDVKTGPTTIAEIFDSFKAVGIMCRVRGRKPDFYGDGFDSNIYIASTNRELLYGLHEPELKNLPDVVFERTNTKHVCLPCHSNFDTSFMTVDGCCFRSSSWLDTPEILQGASNGGRRKSKGRGDAGSGFSAEVPLYDAVNIQSHSQYLGALSYTFSLLSSLGLGSYMNPGISQHTRNIRSTDTPLPSDRPHTHASGDVIFDKIINVDRILNWRGHVYDLSTSDGWFAADGVIVKNCNRHFNSSVLAHGLLLERQGRQGLRKQWDTRMDGKERLWHHDADGQVRTLSEPFLVGGEALLFPVDPRGTPANVIACRCELRILGGIYKDD